MSYVALATDAFDEVVYFYGGAARLSRRRGVGPGERPRPAV